MGLNKGIINDLWYQKLVFLVLILMIVAIPSSRFLMSVSQMGFGLLWILHGHYHEKWKAFIHNKAALLFTSLFLIHVVGVFYSTDLDYALKDLRTKLPILIIPFMFCGFPKIDYLKLEKLFYFYIGSVLVVSIYVTLAHFVLNEQVRDIISRDFISHIRFSLNVNLAIFFLVIMRVKRANWNLIDFPLSLVLAWLLFFLFFLKAFTGVVVFLFLIFSLAFYFIFKSKKFWFRLVSFSIIIFGILGISWYLINFYNTYTTLEEVNVEELETRTPSGNYYYHNLEAGTENGKYIYLYFNEKEMRATWNNRSSVFYDSTDHKNQKIKFTLMRYLTSKDLRKDQGGVQSLNDQDVQNIENGIANVHYTEGIGIDARLMKILLEFENYKRTGNPSGHSVMQRVEYWRTSIRIIKKNFFFGVGTGDMNIAFQEEYKEMGSKLNPDSRLRAHNQYISIWVGLGLVGFVWFVFVLFYPPIINHSFFNLFYYIFFITLTVSMLTEDTIETQAGVTFFVVFNSLFLFLYQKDSVYKSKAISND